MNLDIINNKSLRNSINMIDTENKTKKLLIIGWDENRNIRIDII